MTYITSWPKPKWHGFQKIFLQNVLILIAKSASCFGALVIKREQKEAVSRSRDPFQHQDVLSKDLLGEFCQLQPFRGP